jgi:hypothetical protein
MKLNSHASLSFKTAEPPAQIVFGANVISWMSTSASLVLFPNPPISMGDLKTLNDNLDDAVATAVSSGSKKDASDLKTVRSAWVAGFTSTAKYVTFIASLTDAGASAGVIQAAGYEPTKNQSQPKPKPGMATAFEASITSTKGTIVADSIKAVPNAQAYVFAVLPQGVEMTFSGNTMVLTAGGQTMYITTQIQKSAEIQNLTSLTPYSVSMYAVNTAGIGGISQTQVIAPK